MFFHLPYLYTTRRGNHQPLIGSTSHEHLKGFLFLFFSCPRLPHHSALGANSCPSLVHLISLNLHDGGGGTRECRNAMASLARISNFPSVGELGSSCGVMSGRRCSRLNQKPRSFPPTVCSSCGMAYLAVCFIRTNRIVLECLLRRYLPRAE